jgi:enoyl-CoA hydratase/carnithine racemase
MADESVLFEVEDHVATITLNRPESLNSMNRDLSGALMDALNRVDADPDIRVGVITGNGRAFCAGADLKERAASGGGGGAAGDTVGEFLNLRAENAFNTRNSSKPLLAAVNGIAFGGGMELSLSCELRIASEGARFGLPEITRGFFPGGGGPQRLTRIIPQAMAMEMILTGDPIDAQTALRVGLVSRIVPDDQLLSEAKKLAGRIANHAPLAVRAVKEVAMASPDMTLAQALRFGGTLRWMIGQTDDSKEGPRAFTEKREPNYEGR